MSWREVEMPRTIEWEGVTARYSDEGYGQMKLLADRAKAGDENAERELRSIHLLRATFDLREIEDSNWFVARIPARVRRGLEEAA